MRATTLFLCIFTIIGCNNKTVEKTIIVQPSGTEQATLEIDSSFLSIKVDSLNDTIIAEVEQEEEERLELIMEFEKTSCFGKCPSYKVQVFSNGAVFFEGRANVEHIGLYKSNVNDSFVYTIFQEADKIGFFGLSDQYPVDGLGIPDLPKTITFLKNNNLEHRVIDSYSAPASLRHFENYLSKKFGELYWIQVEESGN